MTVPGPFTLAQLAEDEHYRDEERSVARRAQGGVSVWLDSAVARMRAQS